ncbi:MAG TPA: HTH domain-containing protein, partial [Nitrososphaera sp.]|nr:HTH domain-containing protein [Nitrososphaera sp.]
MRQLGKFFLLLTSEAGYVSGQALAKNAGISRSAVWKQIKALRRYGYAVESRHGLGYKLVGQTDLPLPWELS